MGEDPRIGTQLAGYELEDVVGRGGIGVVYRARQARLGRAVALKVLAPELVANAAFRERFEREAHLAAMIEHPGIVPIYEAGEADGVLFLAMRFVEGTDLGSLLEEAGPLEPGRAVGLLSQVAAALDAAHARDLVHRDIKPGNVLVAPAPGPDEPEQAFLTDFGIAKLTATSAALTGTGFFVGTPDYAAPEQFEGESVGGRADVYALTGVLCFALTGEAPFPRGDTVAVMAAHLLEPPPSLVARRPDLPPAIDDVIAKGMAKAPEERYGTCRELLLAAQAALAAPTAPAPPQRPRGRRSRRAALVAGLLVLAGAGAAAAAVALTNGPARPGATATGKTVLSPGPARLQGSWAVTLTVQSIVNIDNEQAHEVFHDTWTVAPKCSRGVCAVNVTRSANGHTFVLRPGRSGRTYSGSERFKGPFFCNGKTYANGSSYVGVWTVRVTRSAAQGGGSAATRFSGTAVTTGTSHRPDAGCGEISSREVLSLSGLPRSSSA